VLAALIAIGMMPPASPPALADASPANQDTQPARPESQPSTAPATQAGTQPSSQPGTQPVTQPVTQPASVPTTTQAASKPATTTAATTTTATTQAAEKKDRYLAVINGRVHTVTGPVLERATVLTRNGRITTISESVQLPAECEIVDASGKDVYPGLIAAGAGGLHGASPPQDTTDVYSLSMNIAVAVGITTAIAGNSVAKLTYGSVEDMLLKPVAYVNLSYTTRNPLERAQVRADLEKVRNYLRELANYEREKTTDKDAQPPDKAWLRDKNEEYRKLLAREAIAVSTASDTQDLRDLAELATQYDFGVIIRGAVEGWLAAPQLARAGAGVIITPRVNVQPDERFNRPTGSTIENARILHDHGVKVAVVPPSSSILTWGVGGRDLTNLNMEAAFAVRGGMSNDDGVKTITIDAARVLGVDDRVGSLEVGKDADIIVTDGDVLSYMTHVFYTIVNGRLVYDKSKDTLFAHIRPEGKPEVPVFDDYWPRKLEWPK
jgi:hypothetical protein